jgi:hypothetical protein
MAVSACATSPAIELATMPVEILRAEGQPPRMGDVVLEAGGYLEENPFGLNVWFNSDGKTLGKPRQVSWRVRLGDYCRDRPSTVQAVLVGPSGQLWKGWRRDIPAGPDRPSDVVTGSSGATGPGAVATPGLLEAMAEGGVFTVALEDDEGRVWNRVAVDTLRPARRLELFADNQQAVRDADPAMPARSPQMLTVVERQPYTPPPPRPCP